MVALSNVNASPDESISDPGPPPPGGPDSASDTAESPNVTSHGRPAERVSLIDSTKHSYETVYADAPVLVGGDVRTVTRSPISRPNTAASHAVASLSLIHI